MNLTGAKARQFVRRPDPAVRAILLFGPDRGLIRERSDALVAAAGGDIADPFAMVNLESSVLKADPARLADEAAALTFSGRRRVVRVRDGDDRAASAIESWLESGTGESLFIIEAGELGKRSALRSLFEGSASAAAIGCYPDEGADLERFVTEALAAEGLAADGDAAALLASRFGADRSLIRRELEKLVAYKNGEGRVSVEDVIACVGDSRAVTLDAVTDATCGGDLAALERAVRLAFAETLTPVALLRATARHLQRLLYVRGLMARGTSVDKAIAALRPPPFYKTRAAFRRQAEAWSVSRLGTALDLVTTAELECKTTGMPSEALCVRALMRIAHAARRT